ncbi:MAG: multidrug efflux SMR transporter [Arthrobacter sp.]|jgi:small multidrug resistance pump|nr:multidrug efflux SMR transporter [Arthrobacter sp.]
MLVAYLALAGAIVVEVGSTLSLQASDGFRKRRWILPVLAGYGIAYTLLSVSLAHGMPLGVAYGLWTACGVALTAVLARFLFKQPLTWLMSLGLVAIMCGVALVEMGAAH